MFAWAVAFFIVYGIFVSNGNNDSVILCWLDGTRFEVTSSTEAGNDP